MIKKQIVRGFIVASTVLVPVAGISALASSPAGAAAKPKGISCSKLSGTANTTTGKEKIKLSSCSGNTGGSGKQKGTVTETSGTVKWANGKSTSGTETAATGSGCAAGDLTEDISGSVTADSTKSTTVGAALSATVCAAPGSTSGTYNLSLLPGTDFTYAA